MVGKSTGRFLYFSYCFCPGAFDAVGALKRSLDGWVPWMKLVSHGWPVVGAISWLPSHPNSQEIWYLHVLGHLGTPQKPPSECHTLRLDTFWQQHLKNMDFMKSGPSSGWLFFCQRRWGTNKNRREPWGGVKRFTCGLHVQRLSMLKVRRGLQNHNNSTVLGME